jgi:hypothetical protein
MRSRCTASESKSCRISDATSPATPSHASVTTRPACPLRSWPSSPAAVHREAPGARQESDQYPRYMRTARTRRWSSAAGSNPSLEGTAPTCVSTVLEERNNRSLIAWLLRPSAIRPRISRFRSVRPEIALCSRHRPSRLARPRDQSPSRHAVRGERRLQIRHVRKPVLEQVTDRLRRLLEELHRVPRLDALREYEHAHFGGVLDVSVALQAAPRCFRWVAHGCR